MSHGHFLGMGGFTLVSDKVHQLEEPEQPGWMSATADWDPYAEYVRQREMCQLGTLTFERFQELVQDPNVVFPAITAAQIKDRSKGDGLSKLLAIMQSSWFILQCVARGIQGLALTELELVTLAMASLNAITFAFWWSKPLSVQEPVNVYVPAPAGVPGEKSNRRNEEDDDVSITAREFIDESLNEVSRAYRVHKGYNLPGTFGLYLVRLPLRLFFVLTYPVFLLFPLGIFFLLWIIKAKKVEKAQDDNMVATRVVLTLRRLRYKLTRSIRRYFGDMGGPLGNFWFTDYYYQPTYIKNWFIIIPASFFLLVLVLLLISPLFAIFTVASFTFTAVFDIVTSNTVPPGATHVPSFYAPRTKSDRCSRMIVFAIFGVVFGGIHCFGWNFIFPTNSERSIWRYTSVVLTVIPFVAAPIDYILENVKLDSGFSKKVRLALDIFMTIILFTYVPARLSLIAQALALLREQPPAACFAVDWTKYIPHLFN